MADNKVNFLRGTSAEYETKTKDNDTFYYTTDTKKLYLGENEVGNGIDPKVIQAHIDNQTIHAKVWRGTQEEYNAIEPKEDDTVYIIKDSDNTLADKLIDDTSTTTTDKTWSAKKINENDEVARTAINTHAGNDEIHVTAEEKAAWNAKAEMSDIPTTLPANGGNADIARKVETTNQKAILWEDNEGGNLKLVSPDGNHSVEMDLYNNEGFRMYFTDNGELTFPVDYNSTTKKFNINGNADTVDGYHASELFRDLGWWNVNETHNADDILGNGAVFAYTRHSNIPNDGVLVTFKGGNDNDNYRW